MNGNVATSKLNAADIHGGGNNEKARYSQVKQSSELWSMKETRGGGGIATG